MGGQVEQVRCKLDTLGSLQGRIQAQVDSLLPYSMVEVVGKDMVGTVERG